MLPEESQIRLLDRKHHQRLLQSLRIGLTWQEKEILQKYVLFYFQDDVDSLQHVIKYSQQHDAMYEFHYYDENNKVRQ